ncbi:TonB-dependent receptor plug domain-containing protein [Sphingomonas citri]
MSSILGARALALGVSTLVLVQAGAAAAQAVAPVDAAASAATPQVSSDPGQEQATDPATQALDDVVVTGSRIARSTFQTPTPITTITEQQLEQKAATNVVDLLRDIPALRPNRNNGSGRNLGLATFNMRALGSTRTLLLIDGQRALDSSPIANGFDINIIPAPLVARLDIVTAGASSVYGSDAVTGVVNLILADNVQGGKIDAQYNVSTHGDLGQISASAIYGGKFGDGRGRFVAAASYFDQPDVIYQGAREWGRRGVTFIPNAAYTPTNGEFRQLIVPDARYSQMTAGGVITTPGPLRNIQFGQGGAQSRFQQGSNVGTVWMEGGEGLMPQPNFAPLQVASRQISGFARLSYEVSPSLSARLDVLAANTLARSTGNYNTNNGDITVRRDNAFLPANIRDAMIANNLTTIRVGRYNPEQGRNLNSTENSYYRVSGGLSGQLSETWKWQLGGSYTFARSLILGRNNRDQAKWALALDPVVGPSGQVVCRSTLTSPGNGCVPANIFGIDALTPEVNAYVLGTSRQDSRSQSAIANANVSGDLFDTWAGPVKVALGAEYRRDSVDNRSDPVSDVNGWRQGTFGSYYGKLEVKEGYGEISIPLARETGFARSLDLDLAGRFVDYSTVGSTGVWKVGLNYAINDSVRLRGTYSRDFRAPRINDLFAQANIRIGTVTDFLTNRTANVNFLIGGNPNLGPETAYTLTGGIVLQPAFIPRLQLSADFYDIDLRDAIITPGQQEVVDRCGRGDPIFCQGVIRDESGAITQVNANSFNAQTLKTRGIDFEASYNFPLFAGRFTARALATYVDRLISSTATGQVDTAGQLQGGFATPKWRGSTTFLYDQGPLNLRVLFNYIGPGTFDNAFGPLDLNRNHYPAFLYTDMSVQYDVTDRLQLYAKVENLTDTAPPLLAESSITVALATLSQYHDLRGRVVGVGARLRF